MNYLVNSAEMYIKMKKIILNKDDKVLFEYEGVKYLVENYESTYSYHYPNKYLLYSAAPKKFLCFHYYELIHVSYFKEDTCGEDYKSGSAKTVLVKKLIESYLKEKKNRELAESNACNYYKGGTLK